MSISRMRTGMAASAVGATALSVLATVALSGSPASAVDSAPYPPTPTVTATAGPTQAPIPTEVAEAVDDVLEDLDLGDVPASAVAGALNDAAQIAANEGLSVAQAETALATVGAIAEAAADLNLSAAAVQAVTSTSAAAAVALAQIPATDLTPAQSQALVTQLGSSLASIAETLSTNAAAAEAVSESVAQVLDALGSSVSSLTPTMLNALVTQTALVVTGGSPAPPPAGVVVPPPSVGDVTVTFTVSGLLPGSRITLVLNVTQGTIAQALRRLGYTVSLNSDGTATVVLSGTVDERGNASLAAPKELLGITDAADAAATLSKTALTVVGQSASGAEAVFATGAGQKALTAPTVTTRTPAVPVNGTAVISGTATPGTIIHLLAAGPNGVFTIVRHAVVPASGIYSFTVRPTATTRFVVRTLSGSETTTSRQITVALRPTATQAITRVGTRTYRFSGTVTPAAGQIVKVYRSTPSGITGVGQALVNRNGQWSLVKKFAGTGTFSFFARVQPTSRTTFGITPVQRATIK